MKTRKCGASNLKHQRLCGENAKKRKQSPWSHPTFLVESAGDLRYTPLVASIITLMADIISLFPDGKQQPLSPAQIDEIVDALTRELCTRLATENVNIKNADLIRDLAVVQKFIAAALLRLNGSENTFTRILDTIKGGAFGS
jgi:hypothetical protein